MQILSAAQIRAWDTYTIMHEPIASIDLMERAANACCEWIIQQGFEERSFYIFSAKGNNGGDGLAIARILLEKGYRVIVHILEFGHKGTDDFQTNLARLHDLTKNIFYIQQEDQFPILSPQEIIIDALFGSGLNRPLDTHASQLVNWLNNTINTVISIDIPSGLFTEHTSKKNIAIKATHTLSFQCYKPAFLVAENDEYIGMLHVLDIGLHPDYLKTIQPSFEFADMELMKSIYRPRNRFSHKGNFGHALLVGGSYGKMGAVVLAAKACVRTGSGLLSCYVPHSGI
jgi:NAD(P)H-hydrate epimerase